jgi:basic amino acid/polyamine antiporter, APA family
VWRLGAGGRTVLPPVTEDAFTLAGTTGAIGLTLYAMLGFESATIPADAVDDAARIVPRATMVGTALSAVVSVVATCAVVLMLPARDVSASSAPMADFIAASWGNGAGAFVAVCAVVSCLGSVNGFLLLGGELPVAMVQAGALPSWFGARNHAGAPSRAITCGAVISSLLLVAAYTRQGVAAYNFAILISTATNLVIFVLCALAALRLMRANQLPRSGALIGCAIVSLAFSGYALYSAGAESVLWGGVLVACGWPMYVLGRRVSRARDTAAKTP